MNGRMRRTIAIAILITALSLLLSACLGARGQESAALCPRCDRPPRGCTIFTVSQGERVFFGGNGDWINFDSNYYWVDPGSETRYGAIYFGLPSNVQQGFNEKGLAYDANGLPLAPVVEHPGREPVYGSYASYPIHILRACATLKEVIAWVQVHQWHEAMHDQLHFADASGDAVVISAGPDGKVAFARKPAGDGYLVSTNFNLANPINGSWPCWRYDRARALLAQIDGEDELTAERAASVLDAVHVESTTVWTILSVVGDLPRGLVYVYLFHQFDAPIVLDVVAEITNAAEGGRATEPAPLSDLFPPETVSRAERAHQWLVSRSARCDAAGWVWVGLVATSLLALVLVARPQGRTLAFWGVGVALLGPAGLVAWCIAARRQRSRALVEAVGDLLPCVVGMVAALLAMVLVPEIGQNPLRQLGALYGLSLGLGLFVYQAPLLASATQSGYLRTLWQRLPALLVSTHLALAGLMASGAPLITVHLEYCGFGAWTVLSWWGIGVLGGCAGGLLLYAYHAWAVRRGYAAWSALLWGADGTGDDKSSVSFPPWRRLWLWVVVSLLVLIAGIALGLIVSARIAG